MDRWTFLKSAVGAGAFGLRMVWLRADPCATLPRVGAPEPIVAAWADVLGLFLGE